MMLTLFRLFVAGIAGAPAPADEPGPGPGPGVVEPVEEVEQVEPAGSPTTEMLDAFVRPVIDMLVEPDNVVPSFEAARSLARQTSPVLGSADAQRAAAEARRRQALGRALPTLTGASDVNSTLVRTRYREKTELLSTGDRFLVQAAGVRPSPATVASGSISLGIPLVVADRWIAYRASKSSASGAAHDQADAERRTALSLAVAMIDVARQEQAALASRASLQPIIEAVEMTYRQRVLGTAVSLDVHRSEQELILAQQQIVLADETARRARESLGILLGRQGQWGTDAAYVHSGLSADIAKRCQRVGPESRADTRAADARTEAADRTLRATWASFLPWLSGNSTFLGSSQEQTTSGQKFAWGAGVTLTVPLYDGGVRYGRLREARAVHEQRNWEAQDVRRRARLESVQADRGVTVAQHQLDLATQAAERAEKTFEFSQRAFGRGDTSSLEMLDALRRLRLAQLDRTIRRYDLIEAEIRAIIVAGSCQL